VLAPSQSVKDDLARHEHVPTGRIRVTYGCAEGRAEGRQRQAAREALRFRGAEQVIGCVGRLVPEKSYPVLLDAFAEVRERHAAARLVIVGEGPERARIERRIRARRLQPSVQLLGNRADVAGLLPGFDAFALASHIEGLPIAVVEAMMAGVPVVATRVAGTPELVRDGETGLLVPPGDAGALAQAIERCLDEPQAAAERAARAAREVEERFSPARYAKDLVSLYQELAETRAHA
jgi:glycosyltransferase involved in cell wall biosynthesis